MITTNFFRFVPFQIQTKKSPPVWSLKIKWVQVTQVSWLSVQCSDVYVYDTTTLYINNVSILRSEWIACNTGFFIIINVNLTTTWVFIKYTVISTNSCLVLKYWASVKWLGKPRNYRLPHCNCNKDDDDVWIFRKNT